VGASCLHRDLSEPVDDWVLPTGEHFIDPFDAAVKHRLLVNCALLAVGLPTGTLELGAVLFWAARGFWPK
jgi:hypothetical protein